MWYFGDFELLHDQSTIISGIGLFAGVLYFDDGQKQKSPKLMGDFRY